MPIENNQIIKYQDTIVGIAKKFHPQHPSKYFGETMLYWTDGIDNR